MNLLHSFTRLHKWLALLVGIQLILWIVSGIVFSFMNHENVAGRFIYEKNQTNHILHSEDFIELIKDYPMASEISQISLLGKSVFKLVVEDKVLLLGTQTKKTIVIGEELIKQIASRHYQGGGELLQVNLVEQLSDENRNISLPTWQLIYDDEFDSHIYFSATTGEYQAIRTGSWRTFDFFMMLHFMDYGQRGDFNHGLIIIAGIILLFFSMSGMLLIYSSFSRKDFVMLFNRFFEHKKFTVTLVNENGVKRKLKVDRDVRLMDALAEQDIELESVCGGGGICGCCRVKLLSADESVLGDHLADHDTLDDEELEQGYRLACQLSVDANICVEVPDNLLS